MSPGGAPIHWDFTLQPFSPIITRLLDAVGARAVIEVGADRGDFTGELLDWASGSGAKITAVDPEPAPGLVALRESHPELNLVREPSPEALDALLPVQVAILDGDHNYYTLNRELSTIAEGQGETGLPLMLIHDIGWPHARRDTYYATDRVPEEHLRSPVQDVMVAPGHPGTVSAGIRFGWAAAEEGGPRNGVLTAVEDFLERRRGLRLAVIPAFFGLGVLWPEDAPWASAVAEIVEPWDSNPMLRRLEEVRLAYIIDRTRWGRQEEVLRAMLGSRAFGLVDRISRLRRKNDPTVSRERVRRALDDSP
jgi:hypothetical protein